MNLSFDYFPDKFFTFFTVGNSPDFNSSKTAQIGTGCFTTTNNQNDVNILTFGQDKTNFSL